MPVITTEELFNKSAKGGKTFDESQFQTWYKSWADKAGIDPDPDNPLHKYDYRAAYKAGAEPEISDEDGLYHWPSEFKADDHPNRYVKGVDTKTGKRVITTAELVGQEDPIFGRKSLQKMSVAQRLRPVLEGTMQIEDLMPDDSKAFVKDYLETHDDPQGWRDRQVASMLLAEKVGMTPDLVDNQFDSVAQSVFGKKSTARDVINAMNPYPQLPSISAAPEPGYFKRAWSTISEKMGFLPDTGYYESSGRFSKEGQRGPIGQTILGREKLQAKDDFNQKGIVEAAKQGIGQAGIRMSKSLAGDIELAGDIQQKTGMDGSDAQRIGQAMSEYGKSLAMAADMYLTEHPEEAMQLQPGTGIIGTAWQFISRPELIVQGAVESVPYMLEAYLGHITGTKAAKIAVSGATVLPWTGRVAAIGSQSFGETYANARAAETEPMAAFAQATLTGMIEGGIEEFTLGKKVKVFQNEAGRSAMRKLSKLATDTVLGGGKSYVRGFGEEYTQQINQNFWNMIFTENKPLSADFLSRVTEGSLEAGASGGMIEPAMTGAFALAGKVFNAGRMVPDKEKLRRINVMRDWVSQNDVLEQPQKNEIFSELENKKIEILAGKYADRGVGAATVEFQRQVKNAFNVDDKSVGAVTALIQARANAQGKTVEQWLTERVAGVEKNKETDSSLGQEESEHVVSEQYFDQNWRQLRADYIGRFGNVVSVDSAKLLFEPVGYAVEKSNDVDYQSAAGKLANRVFDKLIKERKGKGNGRVLFMAGGTGAGKTTAVDTVLGDVMGDYPVIVDSNLSDINSASQKIDRAIQAGYKPEIVYVYRDPQKAWSDGVLRRVKDGGRYVAIEDHIRLHEQSLKTVQELADKYGDRLDVQIIDNSGRLQDAKIVDNGIDFLRSIRYDLGSLKDAINEETEKQIKDGRIPKDRISERRGNGGGGTPSRGPEIGQVNPDILYQTESSIQESPVFISKLRSVVESKMGGAMDADSLVSMLKNNGVKDEEIDWSGLRDLSGKVNKQMVLDTLAENEIEIQEVEKGEQRVANFTNDEHAEIFRLLKNEDNLGFDDYIEAKKAIIQNEDWASRWDVRNPRLIELGNKLHNETIKAQSEIAKYKQYQISGGENYRELLLTLPVSTSESERMDQIENEISNVESEEERQRLRNEYKSLADQRREAGYYASKHWNEDNVLAHVRFNERMDVDGNRVLFIEEIQSDWHQEGREKGYIQVLIPDQKISIAKRLLEIQTVDKPSASREKDAERYKQLDEEEKILQGKLSDIGIPDAPFKKNWQELAFKRMLRYAAENGYDKVAWTTGAQQVARYETATRRQVNRIDLVRVGDDNYAVMAAKGNDVKFRQEKQTADQVKELVGKSIFEKLVAQIDGGAAIAVVQGSDLTVGGEGMKGFYDKILPDFAKKYVKKWGSEPHTIKIETDGRKTESVHAVDVTDSMVDSVMGGQWLFQEEKLSKRKIAARRRAAERAGDSLGATIRDKMLRDYESAISESGPYQAYLEGRKNLISQIILKGNIGKIDFGSLRTEALEYIEGKPYLRKYVAKEGEGGQKFDEVLDHINAEGAQGEHYGNAAGQKVSISSPMDLLELLDSYETGGKNDKTIHDSALQEVLGSDDPAEWLTANVYKRLREGDSEENIKRFIDDSVATMNDQGGDYQSSDFWDIGGRQLEARKKQIKKSVKKAAAEFLKDGRVIIHAFEAADFSSAVHELGHVFRRELEPELMAEAENFCGVSDGKWTVEAEEKFARSFERYLWEGKAPNQQLKSVFAKFREWLRRIYQSLNGSAIDVRINDDIRRVFDKMLTGPAEIHPGEMTFDEFFGKMGRELENPESVWMQRYGLVTSETPHQMHSRLKKEWAAMQASTTLGEKLPKDFLGSLTVEQRAQVEEIEKAAADIPSTIWQEEKARQVGDLIDKSNADDLVVMEVQKALKKAFETGTKIGADRQKEYLKEILRRARARKVLRDHIKKLAKQIASPAPSTVDLVEREAIALMQAGFDPSFRANKTLEDRQRTREFLEKYPNKDLPRKLFETLNKKALNELTIAELEEMALQRESLEKQGKLKKHLKLEQEARRIEDITGQIVYSVERQIKIKDNTVKADKVNPDDITFDPAGKESGRDAYWVNYKGQAIVEQPHIMKPGETLDRLKSDVIVWLERGTDKPITSFTAKKNLLVAGLQNERVATLTPARLFDKIDGGKGVFDGVMHRTFYDAVNQATDAKLRMVNTRLDAGRAKLKELGLSVDDLAAKRTINGVDYTTQEIMAIYGYSRNFRSKLAIQFGNRISTKTMIDAIWHCESEDPRLGQLAAWMIRELDGHWARMEAAWVEVADKRLVKEENYLPMRRLELDYTDHKDQVKRELEERYALKKAYAQKGFTIQRQDIPPEYQKPIRLDLWSLWMEHVDKEEHLIHLGKLTSDLHKIAGNKSFIDAVERKFGDDFVKAVRNYVSRVANPNIYKAYGYWANLTRSLKSNVAVSYLALNLTTLMNQPTALLYYLADSGSGQLMASVYDFVRSPKQMMQSVWDKDPQTRYTVLDRGLEEMKLAGRRIGDLIPTGTANPVIRKINDIYGSTDWLNKKTVNAVMEAIYWCDQVPRVIGWNAVYQKALADGKSEIEAIREAQNSTLRTQQAAAAKDIPEMFAKNNELLNTFLMFQNQLNKIYNVMTYDIPSAMKSKQYQKAILGIAGVAASAMLIWMIGHRRPPEDENDLLDVCGEQFLSVIPLIGNQLLVAKRGFGGSGNPVFDEIRDIYSSGSSVATGEGDDRDYVRLLESFAALFGIPTIGPKRIYRVVENGDLMELIGGEPKK